MRLFSFHPLVLVSLLTCESLAGGGFLMPTAQTTYSWPLRLGGRLGLNLLEPVEGSRYAYTGTSLSLEAARDGMRLGIGNRCQQMGFLPLFGAGLGVSGLYIWEGDDSAFLGLEAGASILVASIYGGLYRRVSGEALDDLVLSIGFGSGLP